MAFHVLDIIVIATYLCVVILLGKRAARGLKGEEGFFLASRKLGRIYQFFLNFGNSTDANGAVSTASLVYQQGVSGMWLGFQMIFLNPYYWFMNLWFRRARLVTTADLFTDRLGTRGLAPFYAIFQCLSAMIVIIGFGNLITYKITAALLVKSEVTWTAEERASVEGYRELKVLEKELAAGTLPDAGRPRLEHLRELNARGELHSYITLLEPWSFYLVYTCIVGIYIVMGGMAATAVNEVIQSLLIIAFSILLLPVGLAAIGGWGQLGERVPAAMFDLVAAESSVQPITGLALLALLVTAVVQINGIIGNMGISGSSKDEFAARFGAVAGTFGKRIVMILWAFAGLIAVALFQGDRALSDPDMVWGMMSRQLLGPGLLGLMITGILAANMSTVAAQTLAVSALVVRNLIRPLKPALTETGAVLAGRITIVIVLAFGIFAATRLSNVFAAIQLVQTVNVPFGAAVMLMFFWRRLTGPAVWGAVLIAASINIAIPLVATQWESVRTSPSLVVRANDTGGRASPVFFESVVRTRPEDPASPLVGRGRFHLELVILNRAGLDVVGMTPGGRFASRFFFNTISPFVLLIGLSLITRPPSRERVDQFFGKMKTPVGATPDLEAEAMAETRRNPGRFNHTKLFPNSSWEFTKWDRVDTIGFLIACAVSGAIIGLFWIALRLASG